MICSQLFERCVPLRWGIKTYRVTSKIFHGNIVNTRNIVDIQTNFMVFSSLLTCSTLLHISGMREKTQLNTKDVKKINTKLDR